MNQWVPSNGFTGWGAIEPEQAHQHFYKRGHTLEGWFDRDYDRVPNTTTELTFCKNCVASLRKEKKWYGHALEGPSSFYNARGLDITEILSALQQAAA